MIISKNGEKKKNKTHMGKAKYKMLQIQKKIHQLFFQSIITGDLNEV